MSPFLLFSLFFALSEANEAYHEEKALNFTQLAAKYGRDGEEFDVVTEDGYILKLFHLKGNEGKKPVLMMHGQADTADTYILRGNTSIAIALADEGYDIWAGNLRGNKYSRRHVTLDPDLNVKQFWNFSFHENGVYDLPATIDFILDKTGKEKLSGIGHSLGTTTFYVAGSMRPEYNDKVSGFISLAPIAYMSDLPLGPVTVDFKIWPTLSPIMEGLGMEEFAQNWGSAHDLFELFCSQGMLGYDICERGLVAAVVGGDTKKVEPEFFKIALHHYPAGTSRKTTSHFVQVANSGRFAQYDYSLDGGNKELPHLENKELPHGENKELPPLYNLTAASMPIALIVGGHDKESTVKNVKHLKEQLPNVVYYHVIEDFNHQDFTFANNLKERLIPILKDLLLKFD